MNYLTVKYGGIAALVLVAALAVIYVAARMAFPDGMNGKLFFAILAAWFVGEVVVLEFYLKALKRYRSSPH